MHELYRRLPEGFDPVPEESDVDKLRRLHDYLNVSSA